MPRGFQSRPHRIRLAKLTPPILPVVLKRARLFRLLDKSRKRPLTWITALPGAGKSTLVASYIKARRLPVLWYRLDESDADPSSFFHYLSLAAKALAPRFRKPFPVLTPEYALGLPTFTRRFFQEFSERLPRRCVLVLDNYQEVPATSGLHQLLVWGFQELPRHVSVMAVSRQNPPAAMVKLETERAVALIGPEQVEFSKTEAKALVHLHGQRGPTSPTKGIVDDLYRRVGGWAAGIVLTLEHEKKKSTSVSHQFDFTPAAVFQYLASEVMERVAPDVQSLLLKTSLLPDITVPMAERLTNLSTAGEVLASLHRARYFTERRQEPEFSYRYHSLFREFLQQRARQVMTPTEFSALQRKAAGLLVSAGRIEDGVKLLQAAEDWESLARIIFAEAGNLIEQGRVQTLEGWIRSVPEKVRQEMPWLSYWLASTRMVFNSDEAYGLFEQVFGKFRSRGDRVGVLLSWCGMVRTVIFQWADLGRLTKWLDLFPRIHSEGTPYPSIEVEAHVADCMAGIIMQMHPDRTDARAWLDRAVVLNKHLPMDMQTGSRFMTEIYYLWFGDFAAARIVLAQFSSLARSRRWNPITEIFFHVTAACLAWYDSDFNLCRMHVAKARELANASGIHVYDSLVLSQEVFCELHSGNLDAAEGPLKEMDLATERLGGIHRSQYELVFAWFKLLRGDLQQAFEHVHRANSLVATAGRPMFVDGLAQILTANILFGLARRAEATRYCNRVMEIGEQMQSDPLRLGAYLLTAQMAFNREDEAAGLDALRNALVIGEARGLMQNPSPGMSRNAMAELCAKALAAGITVPFVHRMIQRHRFTPPPQARESEAWPWPVKISTLGRFVVQIDGQLLEKKRKAPHRLFDLLKAIIAWGGEDVPITRLMDVFWPDADGDTAKENFHKSLQRLRHLLRLEQVIVVKAGKVSLNRDLCWIDARIFEASVKQGEARAVTTRSNTHVQDDSRTVLLYAGPFLGLADCPSWAAPYRDRLRDRYIKLILCQCDAFNTKHKEADAIRCLEQAIEVDPVGEALYQRLIPLLASNGRHAEAVSLYHRCKSALARWADRQPSPETHRLVQPLQPR